MEGKIGEKKVKIFALAQDPIYIGTGGYKIGRVDNTIIRDLSTNEPKIPGSSLAGVWRYYSVLKIHEYFIDNNLKINKRERIKKNLNEIFKDRFSKTSLHKLIENLYRLILDGTLENQKELIATMFVNILKLKQNEKLLKNISEILDLEDVTDIKMFHRKFIEQFKIKKIFLLIDLFQLTHYCLNEI